MIPVYIKIKKDKELFDEFRMYLNVYKSEFSRFTSFVWLCECYPEYRSIIYARIPGLFVKILSKIYKGLPSLYLQVPSDKIGNNLMIWHGFSTIVNAQSIGDNCSIWQQVTIGNKLDKEESKPRIGNNVKICAGAIIIGDIEIGDNVIIGAGTVVVKNVPPNSVVVGSPNRYIYNNSSN